MPQNLLDRAADWDDLHRWERSELGKALRRLGFTFGEIRRLIPVLKGTLSYPRALRLFVAWVRSFHSRNAEFVLKINLHAGNDEPGARAFWRGATRLDSADFHRTFVKPDGTGHRKNQRSFGVCQVRVRRCTDYWIRTMERVDAIATARWELVASCR